MNCPVCDDPNIPEGAESCTNCGSELRAFHDIQRVQTQRRNYRTMSIVLGALAIVAISYMAALQMMKTTPMEETHMEQASMAISAPAPDAEAQGKMEELESLLIQKDAEIANLKSEVSQLEASSAQSTKADQPTSQVESNVHVIQDGESLWKISERYLGSGFKSNELAEKNQLADPNHIEVGDTLIVKH